MNFKTSKGTVLPLLNLKGKDYLQVAYRILWAREDHPDWSITTEMVKFEPEFVIMRATVFLPNGQILATAHKREDVKHFPDNIEKAETGSVGRALAMCGYGTQFTGDELDEGSRLADSPTPRKADFHASSPVASALVDLGDYVVTVGKKYKGMMLKDIPVNEIQSYVAWLYAQEKNNGPKLSGGALEFVNAAERYLESDTGNG